jgi:hypothetical protein
MISLNLSLRKTTDLILLTGMATILKGGGVAQGSGALRCYSEPSHRFRPPRSLGSQILCFGAPA